MRNPLQVLLRLSLAALAIPAGLFHLSPLDPLSHPIAQQSATEKGSTPRLRGKVCDPSGAPVPGVLLRLEPEMAGSPSSSTHSDDSGKFQLEAPAPGRYLLVAKKEGFATLVTKNVVLARSDQRQVNLVLQVSSSGSLAESNAQPSGASPQFSDEPTFAVAGITDRSNMGLHGSDANVRTSDALAKDAASLRSSANESASTTGAGDARRLAGDAMEKSGDPLGAVREYEAAVKLDPSEANYFAWGAELLLHRAGPAAVQVFGKAAQLHPRSSRLRAGLGAAYYADGQFTEAASQMCLASDMNPGDPQPYLFLGKMEQAAADPFPCSEERLARFVSRQPRNAYANFYYALLLWKNARKSQDAASLAAAERYLRLAVDCDSSLGEVYLQLGMLYNARGEKDAALSAFEKAVAATPHLSAARYQLSLAYRRAGRAAEAEQQLKAYDALRRSEEAQLEKERRELRQFVTILQNGPAAAPN